MADKRITKTKRNIKNTVIKLLSNTQFEKITVSELCRIGEISRITFYTYYNVFRLYRRSNRRLSQTPI